MSTRSGPGENDRGRRNSIRYTPSDSSREALIGKHIEPQPDGCWLYKGNADRYVEVPGTRERMHRWVYETLVEPIEPGHYLQHTCFNKGCCNPAHLVVLTPSEHSRRLHA